MYCIHEDDIIAWQRYNGLEFIQCACRFTERAAAHGNDGSSSKRQEVKLLLRELRRTNPDIEKSIFHSIHSVCLDHGRLQIRRRGAHVCRLLPRAR